MSEILTTDAFDKWFGELKDRVTRIRIQTRIDRAREGNFGDHRTIGKGIAEMRITHGPGYRIYYTIRGSDVIILLAGGNKSTQFTDIRTAQELARQL